MYIIRVSTTKQKTPQIALYRMLYSAVMDNRQELPSVFTESLTKFADAARQLSPTLLNHERMFLKRFVDMSDYEVAQKIRDFILKNGTPEPTDNDATALYKWKYLTLKMNIPANRFKIISENFEVLADESHIQYFRIGGRVEMRYCGLMIDVL